MTRPAVIIGLGGTGQWVTTYVKKELLEDYGRIPDNVRLLSFDTWPDSNTGGNEAAANVVTIGNTKLEKDVEFIPLSGDTFPKGEDVVQRRAPHIGKRISEMGDAYAWLDAPYLRQQVSRTLWDLAIGAGQIRQFGRLGFFNHATSIKSQLELAFNKIKENNPVGDEVQVIFVASFAGGTGAGMFLDMAIMARSLIHLFKPAGAIFRGIFVLPGTFSGGQEMQARAYATWRELARFMNLGSDYGKHEIKYDDHTTVTADTKPFDQVFLVDANRPQFSFTNTKPENGVFPAIATFIGTALDDDAGADLGHAVNMLRGTENKLGFSSFGAYGIQLPISHVINEYSLQLSRDLLRRWLSPMMKKIEGKEEIDGLNPDQAPEKAGQRGAQEMKPFMTLPRHKLAAIVNRARPAVSNPAIVLESLLALTAIYDRFEAYSSGNPKYASYLDDDVQGGYCSPDEDQKVNTNSWLGRLLIPGDYQLTPVNGPDGKKQPVDKDKLNGEVNCTVRAKVPTSRDKGADPTIDQAEEIIAAVENEQDGYIVTHYGLKGGRGSFDTELYKLLIFNSARFKQILEIELLDLLNGTVANVYQGFTGRLGFVEEFLKTLYDTLEWFQTNHLKMVKVARGEKHLETEAKAIYETARSEMVANADKKCLIFFNHPRAHRKQEDYLEAVQNFCEVKKDEKLLALLDDLSSAMKETVEQAKVEVEKWKLALLTSSDSLYSQVQAEYANTRNDIDHQVKVNEALKLYILRNYPAKFEDVLKSPDVIRRIDDQMKCLRWGVSWGDKSEGPLTINCEMFTEGEYASLLKENDTSGHNKRMISKIGRLAWTNFENDHTLIDEIGRPSSSGYRQPEELGQLMVDHSGPMIELSVPGAGVRSALRRAFTTTDIPGYNPAPYMAQLDARNATINPPLNPTIGYQRTNSHNKHKMTMIQWVDRLGVEDFAVYSRMKASYLQQIRSGQSHETASRLHIFPAEGNAAFYENHLPLWLDQEVRELSPRVVLLMTDVERVRMFFQCYALGMIVHGRRGDNISGRWWRLVIPSGLNIRAQDIRFYSSEDDATPDPFILINKFVIGKDEITQAPINWESVKNAVNGVCDAVKEEGLKNLIDAQFGPGLGNLPEISYSGIGIKVDPPLRFVNHLETQGQMYYDDYVMTHGNAAQTNPGWSWIRHEDYRDLADVARMMYIETLLLKRIIRIKEGSLVTVDDEIPTSIYRRPV